jgi:hypothetical protein
MSHGPMYFLKSVVSQSRSDFRADMQGILQVTIKGMTEPVLVVEAQINQQTHCVHGKRSKSLQIWACSTHAKTHTGHVPKDVLQEILERELCKGVLSWRSERTLTGGTRSCRGLVQREWQGQGNGGTAKEGKDMGGGENLATDMKGVEWREPGQVQSVAA